jgi:hypothetical protein
MMMGLLSELTAVLNLIFSRGLWSLTVPIYIEVFLVFPIESFEFLLIDLFVGTLVLKMF